MASNANPKLEVPSPEAQILRQEVLVQKLLSNNEKPLEKSVPQPSSIINSSLINQVKAFMPQIKAANAELEKLEHKASVQIDGDVEDGQQYVEMNLQLYENENSGTSDSDSDSTNSTISPDSSSSSDEADSDDDTVPSKQQKLITEVDEKESN